MTEDQLKTEVLNQYAQGMTVKAILSKNDIDYKQFWQIRKEAGVEPRVAGGLKQILTEEEQSKVVESYSAGTSIRKLAITYDVDRSVINGVLDRTGTKKRTIKEANKKKDFPEKEICEYYSLGGSLTKCAKYFNTTIYTVKKIVKKNGGVVRGEILLY